MAFHLLVDGETSAIVVYNIDELGHDLLIFSKNEFMRSTFLFFNFFLIVCLFIQQMQNAHLFAECAYCRMHICRMCILQNAHVVAECACDHYYEE
jgi:hypothetical protein